LSLRRSCSICIAWHSAGTYRSPGVWSAAGPSRSRRSTLPTTSSSTYHAAWLWPSTKYATRFPGRICWLLTGNVSDSNPWCQNLWLCGWLAPIPGADESFILGWRYEWLGNEVRYSDGKEPGWAWRLDSDDIRNRTLHPFARLETLGSRPYGLEIYVNPGGARLPARSCRFGQGHPHHFWPQAMMIGNGCTGCRWYTFARRTAQLLLITWARTEAAASGPQGLGLEPQRRFWKGPRHHYQCWESGLDHNSHEGATAFSSIFSSSTGS